MIDANKFYSLREIHLKKLLLSPLTKKPLKSVNQIRALLHKNGFLSEFDPVSNLHRYRIKGEDIVRINNLTKV